MIKMPGIDFRNDTGPLFIDSGSISVSEKLWNSLHFAVNETPD
jgi:hypothetical protein